MSTPPIRWRLHLAASPDEVWELLATDGGRRRFWAESADERDGAIDFRFPDGTRLLAPILRLDPARLFALRYFDGSEVRLELAADSAGGTELMLTESDVPADSWAENHAGWVAVLLALKAAADHRVDLRNHDARRTWREGYVDG